MCRLVCDGLIDEFLRNNNPVDLFNDDIHWGALKTYIGADEGLLYKYLEYDAMVYYDPVVEK